MLIAIKYKYKPVMDKLYVLGFLLIPNTHNFFFSLDIIVVGTGLCVRAWARAHAYAHHSFVRPLLAPRLGYTVANCSVCTRYFVGIYYTQRHTLCVFVSFLYSLSISSFESIQPFIVCAQNI